MVKVRGYISITLTAMLLTLIGCGGGMSTPQRADGAGTAPPETTPQFGSQLPPPSALRATSYTAADLLKPGSEYGDALPHNLVTRSGDEGVFTPNWQSPGGNFAELAYATYQFQLDAIRSVSSSTLHVERKLDRLTTCWVAFADFTQDGWDWFTCQVTP